MIIENIIKFPCEAVVLNYKPFNDEPSVNLRCFAQNKEEAEKILKKYNGYEVIFGVAVNNGVDEL